MNKMDRAAISAMFATTIGQIDDMSSLERIFIAAVFYIIWSVSEKLSQPTEEAK